MGRSSVSEETAAGQAGDRAGRSSRREDARVCRWVGRARLRWTRDCGGRGRGSQKPRKATLRAVHSLFLATSRLCRVWAGVTGSALWWVRPLWAAVSRILCSWHPIGCRHGVQVRGGGCGDGQRWGHFWGALQAGLTELLRDGRLRLLPWILTWEAGWMFTDGGRLGWSGLCHVSCYDCFSRVQPAGCRLFLRRQLGRRACSVHCVFPKPSDCVMCVRYQEIKGEWFWFN